MTRGILQNPLQKGADLSCMGLGFVLNILQQVTKAGIIRGCLGQPGGLRSMLLRLLEQDTQGSG